MEASEPGATTASVEGLKVSAADARDWIEAHLGPAKLTQHAHLRDEKVVQLKAVPPKAAEVLAIGQASELAAMKRQNAIARNGEELVLIAKRVLEWERAGYIRGGSTIRSARAVVARIEGASS